jgi:hypothetical protein
MLLSGTQGRAIVRVWFESTVAEVVANLATHFSDMEMMRSARNASRHSAGPLAIPITDIARSLRPECGEIPTAAVCHFIHAALAGTEYPLAIAHHAMLRERAEPGFPDWGEAFNRDVRNSLIRAVLNRHHRLHPSADADSVQIDTSLSPTLLSTGYGLGMLFTVLERLRQLAIGAVESVVDSAFAAASASPMAVFPRLFARRRHDVMRAKAVGNFGRLVQRLDGLVDHLADHFAPAGTSIPSSLGWQQQALFMIGCHQMRVWLWMPSLERREWEKKHPNLPRAFLWSHDVVPQ